MIKRSTVDTLKNIVDVVEVAELYVELKKAGSLFKGLSPFQTEKTPSFMVTPSKGIWHDFSSGQGGDAIGLVQLVEGLTFPEAVEKLCNMYDITVEYDDDGKTERISSAPLEIYKDWCIEQLYKNEIALKYLEDRGVTKTSILEFEIGYSPSSREVVKFVRDSVITENDAIKVGIIDNGNNGLYGRFIDRIMFPIRDHTSKLCGYSGRTIGTHPAKYVNTKDTPLFHKSSLMYGFDKAKDIVAKKNFFILSEGQMDVIMQHQIGLKYAFASMGTALTTSHVKIISRFAKKGIVAYDGDEAGIKAAFKAAELFIKAMIDVKVVIFDDGEDPADLIASGRGKEITELMEKGVPAIRFCIDRILIKYDLKNPFDKTSAFNEISKFSEQMTPIIRQSINEEASQFVGNIANNNTTAYIGSKNKTANSVEMRERALIKAVIISENKEDIKQLVEISKCFSMKEELKCLEKNEFNNKLLTEIYLNENTIPSANVKGDILMLKIWCMKRFIMKIQSSTTVSPKDRIYKMRIAQMKILELENTIKG